MNFNPEEKLEHLINSQLTGSLFETPVNGNDHEAKLAELAFLLKSIPKKPIISPIKQRKYLELNLQPKPGIITSLFSLRNIFVSLSTAGLVLLITASYSIQNSLPGGGVAFGVKKSTEQLRVKFAYNSASQINIQLELAQKRLTEAQEIVANNSTDTAQTVAALTELTKQTQATVATVQKANPDTINTDPSIVAKLSSLAQEQLALINSIKPSADTKPATEAALTSANESTIAVATIKRLATASSEESLTSTQDLPVIISGVISQIDKDFITIDKTRILVTDKTVIKSNKNDTAKLQLNDKVSVSSKNIDNHLVAMEIIIETPLSTPQTEIQGKEQKKPAPSITPTVTSDEALTNIGTVKGTFIFEDPSPTMQTEQ